MVDLLSTFRERASDLIAAINDRGGVSGTIASLRRHMAEADRRRAMAQVRTQLKRLDGQITEMITAVGVQAIGLHKVGQLHSPELQPLCEHIVQLEQAVSWQKGELAALEAALQGPSTPAGRVCPHCKMAVVERASFCAHCGASLPTVEPERFCTDCGRTLRAGAQFCAYCGLSVADQ